MKHLSEKMSLGHPRRSKSLTKIMIGTLLIAFISALAGCDSKPKDNGFTWPNQKKERRGSF